MSVGVWIIYLWLHSFFKGGIKSYTDESKNAAPDQLQILTGLLYVAI